MSLSPPGWWHAIVGYFLFNLKYLLSSMSIVPLSHIGYDKFDREIIA